MAPQCKNYPVITVPSENMRWVTNVYCKVTTHERFKMNCYSIHFTRQQSLACTVSISFACVITKMECFNVTTDFHYNQDKVLFILWIIRKAKPKI